MEDDCDHPAWTSIAAAFNQGAVPTIAVFNKATTPIGFDLG